MAAPEAPTPSGELALVLSGGGARAAYQVGFLRCLGRHFPELRIPILTGVSAGAINTAFLASHAGTLAEKSETLSGLWSELETRRVFRVGPLGLFTQVFRWGAALVSGGNYLPPRGGLVDTSPLRQTLVEFLGAVDGELIGVDFNLRRDNLKAVALTTSSYTTGQSITWVQGREIEHWERADRRSRNCQLGVEHVLASAALPGFFPAVQVGAAWYGDGGMRLTAPFAPAVHLGATRILAISTRYAPTRSEADEPIVVGYPPPSQVVGNILNSIFLDQFDGDALRLERINKLLAKIPEDERENLRPLSLMVLRPSRDLGRLANDYEARLPRSFRFLTRSLGTKKARSNDLLSLVMFQQDYLRCLIDLGDADTEARIGELKDFLGR